jgi:hypothetical protein
MLAPRSVSPGSSRFRGDVPIQKGREAVGDGHRNNDGSGVAMTHVGCPSCCVRFTPASAAQLASCPECGRPLRPIVGAEGVVGFRLFVPEDVTQEMPEAVAVSIPIVDPAGAQ